MSSERHRGNGAQTVSSSTAKSKLTPTQQGQDQHKQNKSLKNQNPIPSAHLSNSCSPPALTPFPPFLFHFSPSYDLDHFQNTSAIAIVLLYLSGFPLDPLL